MEFDKMENVAIYNVVDDLPCSRMEVFEYLKRIISEFGCEEYLSKTGGVVRSKERGIKLDGAMVEEEKRVRNDKIKDKLKIKLEYPTYKEGMYAICKGDMNPF